MTMCVQEVGLHFVRALCLCVVFVLLSSELLRHLSLVLGLIVRLVLEEAEAGMSMRMRRRRLLRLMLRLRLRHAESVLQRERAIGCAAIRLCRVRLQLLLLWWRWEVHEGRFVRRRREVVQWRLSGGILLLVMLMRMARIDMHRLRMLHGLMRTGSRLVCAAGMGCCSCCRCRRCRLLLLGRILGVPLRLLDVPPLSSRFR